MKRLPTIHVSLAFLFLTVAIMTFWWQILFKRNLENFLPARFFALEQKAKETLYKGGRGKKNLLLFEEVKSCTLPLCFEYEGKIYQIKSQIYYSLLEEKKKEEKIFFYESLFLIFVLVGSAFYMVFLIKKEIMQYREREEFLAMATHELKHPMSTILLVLEGLKRGSLKKKQKNYFIDKGIYEILRLKKQIEGLLKLEEVSLYSKKEKESYSLANLLFKIKNQLEDEYKAQGRIIVRSLADPLVKVNQMGLEIILVNLIENALLYSNKEVLVEVLSKRREVVLRIQDFGIGFTKEEKKKVGTLFYRSQRIEVQKVKGHGLGLFTVFFLANKMKIKVYFNSEGQNKGSVFVLRIKKP